MSPHVLFNVLLGNHLFADRTWLLWMRSHVSFQHQHSFVASKNLWKDSRSMDSARVPFAFHKNFLSKIKTFGVFTGSVSRLEGNERQNLHVTLSIHEMLKGKSLKWTWKVFLTGFSTEIVVLNVVNGQKLKQKSDCDWSAVKFSVILLDFLDLLMIFPFFSPLRTRKRFSKKEKFMPLCWCL